jgi:hypothetical protein
MKTSKMGIRFTHHTPTYCGCALNRGGRKIINRRWLAMAPGLLRSLLLGAPRSSVSRQVSNWAPLFSVQRWSHRFPLAYERLCELRNLAHRIVVVHEKGLANEGLYFHSAGSVCEVGGAECRTRIQGIQNLRTLRLWVSLFDELTFLEGHAMGCRSCGLQSIPKFPVVPLVRSPEGNDGRRDKGTQGEVRCVAGEDVPNHNL